MFVVVLFTVSQNWKQLECASTVEWINKLLPPCKGTHPYNKNERTMDTPRSMDESQMCYCLVREATLTILFNPYHILEKVTVMLNNRLMVARGRVGGGDD